MNQPTKFRLTRIDWLDFFSKPQNWICFLLLLFSTNLGLINRRLGVQNSLDQNIISGRDLLLACCAVWGLKHLFRNSSNNRYASIAIFLLFLSPFASVIGITYGASFSALMMSASIMASWILIGSLKGIASDKKRLVLLVWLLKAVGVLLSIGVFVETYTGGSVALVTPATEALNKTVRSTPTGWPIMLVAFALFVVSFFREFKLSQIVVNVLFLALIGTAALLTQSRTLVVGIVGSTVIFLTFATLKMPGRINWVNLIAIYFGATLVFALTLNLGENYHREGFSDYFIERYSVLHDEEVRNKQIERDGRIAEFNYVVKNHFLPSPLVGKGLGTPVYPDSKSPTVHNILCFFGMRFGIVGLLIWIAFCFFVIRSLWYSVSDSGSVSVEGQGLATAMLSLVFAAFLGNVFGVTYGAQQAMITLGCLVVYEDIRHYERTSFENVEFEMSNQVKYSNALAGANSYQA